MDTDVVVLDPEKVSSDELTELRDVVLRVQSPTVKAFLTMVLSTVEKGKGVTASSTDALVSSEVAAKHLGMSRPHLYKLLDDGTIPFTRVGTHRRVAIADLIVYLARRAEARAHLAESFANAEQDRSELIAELSGVDVETARRLGF